MMLFLIFGIRKYYQPFAPPFPTVLLAGRAGCWNGGNRTKLSLSTQPALMASTIQS